MLLRFNYAQLFRPECPTHLGGIAISPWIKSVVCGRSASDCTTFLGLMMFTSIKHECVVQLNADVLRDLGAFGSSILSCLVPLKAAFASFWSAMLTKLLWCDCMRCSCLSGIGSCEG